MENNTVSILREFLGRNSKLSEVGDAASRILAPFEPNPPARFFMVCYAIYTEWVNPAPVEQHDLTQAAQRIEGYISQYA